VVVAGGGVAGMAAAQMLDRHGLEVHLFETSDHLGGNSVQWACMATNHCNYCGACLSDEMVEQIAHRPGIQVHLDSELTAIVREDGQYRVTAEGKSRQELSAHGIIWATGMTPFDPARIESLQYGRHPRILTTADLNHRLRSDTLSELLGEKSNPAIAFLQCIGSRNRSLGNDYCSQVCCKVALRQADKLHQLMPEAGLTICHIDLQWIGKQIRDQVRELADRIELLHGVPGEILVDPDTDRLITVHNDPAGGDRMARSFDLIVLAVGMRPAKGVDTLLGPMGIPFDDWGFVSGKAELPPRIHVAGAAKFPTNIANARQQGINAAYRLIEELDQLPPIAPTGSVAVFGNGWEGRRVAHAIQTAGYATVLLDGDSASDSGNAPYEHVSQAQITGISKTDDRFAITATADDQKRHYHANALVVANGVRHRPVESDAPVMRLSDLEQTLSADRRQIPQRIVFWLDHSGPEYKTNCRRALESAVDLAASGRHVSVIVEKVLVHGPEGQRLYDRARHEGVRFIRAANAAAVSITRTEAGLHIDLKEASLGEMELSLSCDLVVASEQVLPASQAPTIGRLIAEPLDHQGFSQWANVRYYPINSRKRCVFYVGSCHNENDANDLDSEITTLLGELACTFTRHEASDETAEIDPNRCVRCLNCLRTCTHGAVQLAQDRQPRIRQEDCAGCGRCVAQCPAQAIDMCDVATDTQLTAETVVFACRRSGHLAAERARADGLVATDPKLSIIPVPCCNSRIGMTELIKPLAMGARRVVVAACHPGNCRSVESGGRAAAHLQEQAPALGLAQNAIRWSTIAANEPRRLHQVLEDDSTGAIERKGDQ
jgi:heterodisulfide reductase subunit A